MDIEAICSVSLLLTNLLWIYSWTNVSVPMVVVLYNKFLEVRLLSPFTFESTKLPANPYQQYMTMYPCHTLLINILVLIVNMGNKIWLVSLFAFVYDKCFINMLFYNYVILLFHTFTVNFSWEFTVHVLLFLLWNFLLICKNPLYTRMLVFCLKSLQIFSHSEFSKTSRSLLGDKESIFRHEEIFDYLIESGSYIMHLICINSG